jgi:hypothetical protein
VTGDREERNRVLGFPVERHPNIRPAGKPRQPRQAAQPQPPRQAAQPQPPRQAAQPQPQDAEPQRVLGLPVDWLDGFADEMLRILRRIRGNGNLKHRK